MKVHEIMSYPVVTVGQDTPLHEVARIMLAENIGAVPVVDAAGQLRGIVTDSDFVARERHLAVSTRPIVEVFGELVDDYGIEAAYRKVRSRPVSEVMTSPVVTTERDAPFASVVKQMLEHRIRHVPVVQDGQPVGMVTPRDLLRIMVADAPSGRPTDAPGARRRAPR